MCKGLVGYIRVSTDKQGRSGLGLEAQQKAIADYAASVGLPVIAEFKEVESGKNDERQQLQAAIEHCELTNARLVIAKLDRLSRNVAFVAKLQEAGVKFVCCDMPEANETMVQFLAVMAQAERNAISERTKAALAAAKARGVTLGNPKLEEARAARKAGSDMSMATAVRVQKSSERANRIMNIIRRSDPDNTMSIADKVRLLNGMGITTARGCKWTRAAVSRVMKKAAQGE